MIWDDELIWCDGCGVEISCGCVVVGGRRFCCQDCAHGIPCRCGERMEMDEGYRNSTSASIATSGYFA